MAEDPTTWHTFQELWARSTSRARLGTSVTYVKVHISWLVLIQDFDAALIPG